MSPSMAVFVIPEFLTKLTMLEKPEEDYYYVRVFDFAKCSEFCVVFFNTSSKVLFKSNL